MKKGIAVAGLQRLAAHEAVDLGVHVRISLNLNHLVGRSTVRTFQIEWLLHRRLQSHPIKRTTLALTQFLPGTYEPDTRRN